jgi:cysteine desulfurase / selenocysteine lyase
MLDPNKIKSRFPIFSDSKNTDLVFLDNASTTQKPDVVLEKLNEFYSQYNANVHRGIYRIGELATMEYESVRQKIAGFIKAKSEKNIVFTKGTTESINLVAYSWARKNLMPGDEILVTEMEHHSNLVPWQLAAQQTGATLRYIPITEAGELELSDLGKYINSKTKLIAVVHQSNILGTINPIKKIIDYAHNFDAKVLIDGAQYITHAPLDVNELDCDFYTFSGHKMMGPTGVGVLYARQDLLEEMEPFLSGGDMILSVSMEKSTWNDIPYKFEAGTPNIAQVIGMGAAIQFIEDTGIENIDDYIKSLTKSAITKLQSVKGLQVYGHAQSSDSTSVISFNLDDIHPHDVAQFLDMDNIAVRAGHHCTQPVMLKYKISSTVRASLYIYNTPEDVEKLAASLEKTIRFMA